MRMGNPRLQNFVWESPEERLWREGKGAALCLERLREAREQGQWSEALEQATALIGAVSDLAQLDPSGAEAFWQETGAAVAGLTDALHPLLVINSDTPLAEPERSDLCWQLCTLLDRLLSTPAQLPPRLAGMHTHLLVYGGIYWRKRHQASGEDIERATHLFGRAAHRLDPVPPWLVQACEELGVNPIADPGPEPAVPPPEDPLPADLTAEVGAGEPKREPKPAAAACAPSRLWPPSQLAVEVEQWLLDADPNRPVRIGLACVPGAAMLCREGPRLDLNIAALLDDPSGVAPDPWLTAMRDPLQRAQAGGWLQQLELREPFSSLYESLCHHWRLGGKMPLRQLQRLPALLDAWHRLLGPGQLHARRQPSSLLGTAGCCSEPATGLQVRLDPLELAMLRACDPSRHQSLDEARCEIDSLLAQLRRNHHNSNFWDAAAPEARELEPNPLEALRVFHRDAGFYASTANGPACLERWREGALASLQRAHLWADEQTFGAPALLQLTQLLTEVSGHLPVLQQRPALLELLERLEGREVLYVGWDWEPVLEQHHSGRAFRLFDDHSVDPYGLRAVAMPDSRHPRRPHTGFCDSLERLVSAVEREHVARPIELLLVDGGAYRLPLLDLVQRRHGIAAVAPGAELVQLFGLDRANLPRWRQENRNPEAWRGLL